METFAPNSTKLSFGTFIGHNLARLTGTYCLFKITVLETANNSNTDNNIEKET